jgi:hypothetical protein
VSGEDGPPHSAVPVVRDDIDPFIASRPGLLGRGIGTRIVDDDDVVDELGHRCYGRPDQRLLVEGGDDDRDTKAFEQC